MNDDINKSPINTDLLVAWINQFNKPVYFVAACMNGKWYSNGAEIATPCYWSYLPEIKK